MMCSERVVLPDDSGPKISMMRPRGTPPTPRAASTPIEPVEIALIGGELLRPEAHDRAFAELALDLRERGFGCLQFVSGYDGHLPAPSSVFPGCVAEERRGKRSSATDIRVVRRVYDVDLERARNCAKGPVFVREVYNLETAMKLSVMIAMMLTTLSCAATRTQPIEPWSIDVTSSGGLAGKGAGSYAIDSAGKISVTTMTGKSCTFQATDEERSRFRELLTNARPDTWSASYIPEDPCCDRFEYELTLDEAGVKHTVKWIDDPLPMPRDLEALTNAMVGPPPSLRVTYGAQCQ